MKSQTELLQGANNIPSDDLQGFELTPDQLDIVEIAEGFAWDEWVKISSYVGYAAIEDHVPEYFEPRLQVVGRWTLADPKQQDFVR